MRFVLLKVIGNLKSIIIELYQILCLEIHAYEL